MTGLARYVCGLSVALVTSAAAAEDPNWPQERLDEVLSGASYVLYLASMCQSMFLRGSPIPDSSSEVLEATDEGGTITVTIGTDAPFQDRMSEMRARLYAEDDVYIEMDCEGTAHLAQGTGADVWGALRRHEAGIGATLTGRNLGEPSPEMLRISTCLMNYPAAGVRVQMDTTFLRPEPGSDDLVVRFSGFQAEDWDGYGCLELD